jgi:WD40 repeat protein
MTVGIAALGFLSGCVYTGSPSEARPTQISYLHALPILAVAASPDGSYVATASEDKTIIIVRPSTPDETTTLLAHDDWVTSLAFNPTSPQLASGGKDGKLILWSTETWERIGEPLFSGEGIWALAYSPSGSMLAVALEDGSVEVLDALDGRRQVLLRPDAERTNAVTFSPNSDTVLATAHGGDAPEDIVAILWDISTGNELNRLIGHVPTSQAIVTTDPNMGNDLLQSGVLAGNVNDVEFIPDGSRIATAGEDGTVRVWSTLTGAQIDSYQVLGVGLKTAVYSHDGKFIFTGGSNGFAALLNAETLDTLEEIPREGIILNSAAFTPIDAFVVAGYFDGALRIWPTRLQTP